MAFSNGRGDRRARMLALVPIVRRGDLRGRVAWRELAQLAKLEIKRAEKLRIRDKAAAIALALEVQRIVDDADPRARGSR